MSRAPLSQTTRHHQAQSKLYKKIPPEAAPDLPHLSKTAITTANRYSWAEIDWMNNRLLAARLSTLKQYLDGIREGLVGANGDNPSASFTRQDPSALSVGNASSLSMGVTTPGTLVLYTSSSGTNFVQASSNDDSMMMDLSQDFFVPPTIVDDVDDPIFTDADADALVAQQAAAAEEMHRAEQDAKRLQKAADRLKLKAPRSASGYKRFWDGVKKTLPRTVPVLYNLILGNSSLSDIVGYADEDGWKKGSSSFYNLNPWCCPSDAAQLVADCFFYLFNVHNTQLQTALDSGVAMDSLNSLSRMVEDVNLDILKGSHFLCEMSLTHSRLTGYRYTSAYMGRLISSGWFVFGSKRNDKASTQEEGSSAADDDDDTRHTLLSNSDNDETKAALIADASRIVEDARVAGISSTGRASRASYTDEDLRAMLVPEADLESGTVMAPSFGELIAGCEALFAALKRMIVNPTDPLAGGGMTGAIGSMVMSYIQGFYYDLPDSLGSQACRLEAAWPGILKNFSRNGRGRVFIDYNPVSTWPMSLTQILLSVLETHVKVGNWVQHSSFATYNSVPTPALLAHIMAIDHQIDLEIYRHFNVGFFQSLQQNPANLRVMFDLMHEYAFSSAREWFGQHDINFPPLEESSGSSSGGSNSGD